MNPLFMALLLVGLWGAFVWSAVRRVALLRLGANTWENRFSHLAARLKAVWIYAIYQKKMRYYWLAGVAHQLIFLGFVVLLLRSLILWGRGFDPTFNFWVFGPSQPLGQVYAFLKDCFAGLVLLGTAVFVYYRVINPQKRMALGLEGLVILGIIATMMLADLVYDGASRVINARADALCAGETSMWCEQATLLRAPLGPAHDLGFHLWPEPGGSLFGAALSGQELSTLVVLSHVGFWTHSALVLVFLNILPYSKHFHILTAVPNVALGDQTPKGRLRPLAASTEELMGQVEKASEQEDLSAARLGYGRLGHFTWKDMLDFYTCTECGRCSDNCPATKTGKILSPKHFTLELRDHLYSHKPGAPPSKPVDLVPNVIHEDVLWACTTCRACEEQCPVEITYVDKIVQMRRHLVTLRGEFPAELNKPFEGMQVNGNPWNLSRLDRAAWTEGLEIPRAKDHPQAEVLFWVGCAAAYDDRAKRTARATAQLLKKAGVDFAILAEEESCTGDPARRAGNEYLFSMLAEANVATLNGYKEQGGIKLIVTTCPHCFNTLKNEYPDFGARFEVVHHTDYLMGLVAAGKLTPTEPVRARVAFHDSCYLGRYNDVFEPPREVLKKIPGVELVEVPHWNKKRGLCCGAGGAQMWMEEQNKDRVNVKRTLQLLDTGATKLASACPFCMTMLSDGIKAHSKESEVENLDVVELLARSCGVEDDATTL